MAAFTLAGAAAGLSGGLFAYAKGSVFPSYVHVSHSVDALLMVLLGGVQTVAGPIVGALWVRGLPAFFPDNDVVPLLSSGIGLLVLLLYFPGGLVQLAYSARDALFARVKQHFTEPQIVELTAAIAFENFRSKFNPTLGVEAQGFCMVPKR